VEISLLVMFLT